MALVSLRESQLAQLERDGTARGKRLVALARDPNRFLATIQIGITLAGFLASAAAAGVPGRATRALPVRAGRCGRGRRHRPRHGGPHRGHARAR
ncbi:CNNM domain-containing protein [Ornithinibacter aureus]